MSDKFFNPDDIQQITSRMGVKKNRPCQRTSTHGIPDFVPRKPARPQPQQRYPDGHQNQGQDDAVWAAAADAAVQQVQELPPPANPCFSQADIDEFLARKPQKYQMTERDYKELGHNIVLGLGDLVHGAVATTVVSAGIVAEAVADSPKMRQSSYEYGYMGWGWYFEDGSFSG
ncbi:hypothetical protein V8420_001686 [Salmonella enterica subsp. enterica]|nr:hypothetical protein [Salmonella enterica subsp. enterica serovar Stanley]EBY2753807.1 hypothetical protein [Salmonella enterica subsp. enterica serovar Kottbus]EHN5889134.1 hypothetical protein [Salmonella enterica subsp. enterica serovar Newport]